MATRCTVCRHEQRARLERALAGGATHQEAADRFGLSKGAVGRHVRGGHAKRDVARAGAVREDLGAVVLSEALDRLHPSDAEPRGREVGDSIEVPSFRAWVCFCAVVVEALSRWPTTAIWAADKLAALGLADLAVVLVAGVPRQMLRDALAEDSARRAYIPSSWVEEGPKAQQGERQGSSHALARAHIEEVARAAT